MSKLVAHLVIRYLRKLMHGHFRHTALPRTTTKWAAVRS